MKICTKCGESKPVDEFHRKSKSSGIRRAACKKCMSSGNLRRRQTEEGRAASAGYSKKYNNSEAGQARHLEWRLSPRGKYLRKKAKQKYLRTEKGLEAQRRDARKYKGRHPEKSAAHRVIRSAIRNGSLTVQSCEVCGLDHVDAHHDDYTKPLDVRWLCRQHHSEHHVREQQAVA